MPVRILAAIAVALACVHASIAAAQQAPHPAGWDDLVAAARKEGALELSLNGQVPLKVRKALPAFEKRYGIKVNTHRGGAREQSARILAEQRAGRRTIDMWLGGASAAIDVFLPNRMLRRMDEMLIHPEVINPKSWHGGQIPFLDGGRRYVVVWGAAPSHPIVHNSDLVKPEEIRSYFDVFNPKWKGKIIASAPGSAGSFSTVLPMYLNPRIGEEWFRRLASEMDVTYVKDPRQGAEWIAMGRYAIGLFALGSQARTLQKQGFPIREYFPHDMKEGGNLQNGAGNLFAFTDAPHPNAAKLFANWALSREAQALFIKYGERTDSLRNDVPNDTIPEHIRIKPNVEYFIGFTHPDFIPRAREINTRLKEILRDSGRK